MDRGYLKLWRKSLESMQWQNEAIWRLWCYCLLKANYKERWVSVRTGKGEIEVHLMPGQFIFGRNSAAKALKWNPNTTYKRILKLKKAGKCNIESNTHYSIVTINNWETYQGSSELECQPKYQPSNNQVTAKCQPSNTDKKDKKVKNINSNAKHIFRNSPFFAFEAFKAEIKRFESTKDWSEEKIKHYYESAVDYSETNQGKKYNNWVSAVKMWDRKHQNRSNNKPMSQPF